MGFSFACFILSIIIFFSFLGYGSCLTSPINLLKGSVLKIGASYAIGVCVVAVLLLPLGLLSLYNSYTFSFMAVVGLLFFAKNRVYFSFKLSLSKTFSKLSYSSVAMLLIVFFLLLTTLIAASAPPGNVDPLWHRLVIVKYYCAHSSLRINWDCVPHILLPQYGEILMVPPYYFCKSQGVHFFVFQQWLGCFMLIFGVANKRWGLNAGVFAIFAFITIAPVIEYMNVAMTDASLILSLLASYIFVSILINSTLFHMEKWIVTVCAALSLGVAFGIKTNSVWMILPIVLVLFFHIRRVKLTAIFALAVLSLSVGTVWMTRNYFITGNPFWPMGGKIFGIGPISHSVYNSLMEDFLHHGGNGLGNSLSAGIKGVFWMLCSPQDRFYTSGILSPYLFIFLPTILLLAFRKCKDPLFFIIWTSLPIGYIGIFMTQPRLRYILPALAILSIASSGVYTVFRKKPFWKHAIPISIAFTLPIFISEAAFYHYQSIKFAFTGNTPAYYEARLPSTLAGSPESLDLLKINKLLNSYDKICIFNSKNFYCDVDCISEKTLAYIMESKHVDLNHAILLSGCEYAYVPSCLHFNILELKCLNPMKKLRYGILYKVTSKDQRQ